MTEWKRPGARVCVGAATRLRVLVASACLGVVQQGAGGAAVLRRGALITSTAGAAHKAVAPRPAARSAA
jgi:hypothetical protein